MNLPAELQWLENLTANASIHNTTITASPNPAPLLGHSGKCNSVTSFARFASTGSASAASFCLLPGSQRVVSRLPSSIALALLKLEARSRRCKHSLRQCWRVLAMMPIIREVHSDHSLSNSTENDTVVEYVRHDATIVVAKLILYERRMKRRVKYQS